MPPVERKSSGEDDVLLANINKHFQSPEFRRCVDPEQYLVRWFESFELISASKGENGRGKLIARFPVQKEYLQGFGTYAGGAQSAVHDTCTGWALYTVAKPGFWASLGSSRVLNMAYFRAAREGEVLRLEAQIVNIGSRMAMVRGTLFRETDGQIISTSEHHLYNNEAPDVKL